MTDEADRAGADDADLVAVEIELVETGKLLDAAASAHRTATAALSSARSSRLNALLKTHFTPPSTTGDHRREHRPGRPRKIDADPELRAFLLARVDHMTFPELADAVAETFPPKRRIGKSAIHSWWTARKDR